MSKTLGARLIIVVMAFCAFSVSLSAQEVYLKTEDRPDLFLVTSDDGANSQFLVEIYDKGAVCVAQKMPSDTSFVTLIWIMDKPPKWEEQGEDMVIKFNDRDMTLRFKSFPDGSVKMTAVGTDSTRRSYTGRRVQPSDKLLMNMDTKIKIVPKSWVDQKGEDKFIINDKVGGKQVFKCKL